MDDAPKRMRSTADYADYNQRQDKPPIPDADRPRPKAGRWVKLVMALVLLTGAGALAYTQLNNPDSAKKQQVGTAPTPAPKSNVISTGTKQYSSPQFGLEFDYPSDWKVQDEQGSGKLTVTSPTLSLTDMDGRKFNGQIVLTLQDKRQQLSEFDKGPAVASRESEKLAYAKPSQSQRGSTYISLLRYFGSTGSGQDYDAVYITGDNGYQAGQNAPKTDFAAVDPVISITYLKDGKQVTVADNMWDDPDYSKPLKAMLQSLTIQ